MKVKLIYDLDDEDDKYLHSLAIQSPRLSVALTSFRDVLRKKRKYENNEEAANIEAEFYEIMELYNIDLD